MIELIDEPEIVGILKRGVKQEETHVNFGEERTLVALRHPNVVEVQRYVEANGTAYMVKPFYEGVTMRDTVRAMAHRVMVMKNGDVVEEGETLALFDAPQQAYTRELLAAAHLA